MSSHYYGIAEMGFTGAAVLGLAVWQLWSLRREAARDAADAARDSAEGAGHPVGEHRLDDR